MVYLLQVNNQSIICHTTKEICKPTFVDIEQLIAQSQEAGILAKCIIEDIQYA